MRALRRVLSWAENALGTVLTFTDELVAGGDPMHEIRTILGLLEAMKPEDRLEALREILETWCPHCAYAARDKNGRRCNCTEEA